MGIAERKEREKQQRKEEIINAAEKVFFSKGFGQATMDDIAEEAELSKGTLYLYFKSKDDLHLAVARRGMLLLRERTNTAIDKGGNALEILERMGWACVEFSQSNTNHLLAIMTLDEVQDESISLSVRDVQNMIYSESTVGSLLQVVKQGVEEGLIRPDLNPVLIAHTIWMSVFSVLRFVGVKSNLLDILEIDQQTVYASHFEMVFNGIRK